ncbi:MAG: acetyl-CoA carboxylase carboxyl transferase subunit alpha [Atopobiaceae bacterium]|jgi:acetyl-CoA carboxylase carboxyl transferase subunit beta|nr:acetyl-CoA carboxylase carboxyl transferase subunit alpha [Atopobiaceae bacterium]
MTDERHAKSANELEGPVTEVPVELPERHVLVRCPGCRRAVDAAELSSALDVCPRCGTHLRIGARRRIEVTIDDGSFEEWDEGLEAVDLLGFPDYPAKLEAAREKSGELDGVITGRASIGGEACALFVMNGDFMMGSMGSAVGERICRAFERATEEGLPVVGFAVSGGARMQEGTTSLMQMAKVSAAVRRHGEEGLAYLVVLTDPTSGGVTASFAMEADVCLAEPGALVAFAGPRVVEQTTHRRLPAGFQSAEFQLSHGFVDAIVERSELPGAISGLLALHDPSARGPEHAERLPRWPLPLRDQEPLRPDASAYERVERVRSNHRPTIPALIDQVFDGFFELHGDRGFGDDPAIVAGIAWLAGRPVTVIGTDRGRNTKERVERNFGSPNPEGYRKALRLMRQAEKFGRPVVCLVDTSGAYCGMGAEERGQGAAIADSIVAMSGLSVPEVTVICGEGGSGGALALAVADRVCMLSGAVYSVVSPEGCASILWRSAKRAPEAAEALRITAPELERMGLVDEVIDEAGMGTSAFADAFGARLASMIDELSGLDASELVSRRYDKFRSMGRFSE